MKFDARQGGSYPETFKRGGSVYRIHPELQWSQGSYQVRRSGSTEVSASVYDWSSGKRVEVPSAAGRSGEDGKFKPGAPSHLKGKDFTVRGGVVYVREETGMAREKPKYCEARGCTKSPKKTEKMRLALSSPVRREHTFWLCNKHAKKAKSGNVSIEVGGDREKERLISRGDLSLESVESYSHKVILPEGEGAPIFAIDEDDAKRIAEDYEGAVVVENDNTEWPEGIVESVEEPNLEAMLPWHDDPMVESY